MSIPPKGKLRWQCRRGMRELDELLVRYLEYRYDLADPTEKSAFAALLSLSDPELVGYLLQKIMPAPEFADVIQRILECPDS